MKSHLCRLERNDLRFSSMDIHEERGLGARSRKKWLVPASMDLLLLDQEGYKYLVSFMLWIFFLKHLIINYCSVKNFFSASDQDILIWVFLSTSSPELFIYMFLSRWGFEQILKHPVNLKSRKHFFFFFTLKLLRDSSPCPQFYLHSSDICLQQTFASNLLHDG